VPNFAGLTSGTIEITPENEQHLRTVYEARTDKELPVLVRALPGLQIMPDCMMLWLGDVACCHDEF
jgi:hypothetical protein